MEAWVGWSLAPGKTRTEPREQILRSGDRVPAQVRNEFVGFRSGVASLKATTTVTGKALAGMMTRMAQGMGQNDVPKELVKDGRFVTTFAADTRPESLRPLHTRYEQQRDLTLHDGSKQSERELRDLQWDWEHAQGCGRR